MSLSIILPYYNAANTLQKAIASIQAQTYTDYELILINNNSSDQSAQIAQQMAMADKRIILANETRQGVVFASAKGHQLASRQLIARMDADDYAAAQRMEKQVAYLASNPQIQLVATQVSVSGLTGGFQRYIDWQNSQCTPAQILASQFVEAPFANPTIMYRASCYQKYGTYTDGDYPEDYELWLRWLSQGVQMAKIPEKLLHWNDSPQRLTRSDTRYRPQAFDRIKAKYLAIWLAKHNPFHPHIAAWGSGRRSRKRAVLLQEQGIVIDFFIDIKSENRHNCIHSSEVQQAGRYFIVTLVGKWDARDIISTWLQAHNFKETIDYILAS